VILLVFPKYQVVFSLSVGFIKSPTFQKSRGFNKIKVVDVY
jgi:hypothetical protein